MCSEPKTKGTISRDYQVFNARIRWCKPKKEEENKKVPLSLPNKIKIPTFSFLQPQQWESTDTYEKKRQNKTKLTEHWQLRTITLLKQQRSSTILFYRFISTFFARFPSSKRRSFLTTRSSHHPSLAFSFPLDKLFPFNSQVIDGGEKPEYKASSQPIELPS